MPIYLLNGKPLNDTFRNVFYLKGTIDANQIFDFGVNVYEYDSGYNLTSLKAADGIMKYSALSYLFGAPPPTPVTMTVLNNAVRPFRSYRRPIRLIASDFTNGNYNNPDLKGLDGYSVSSSELNKNFKLSELQYLSGGGFRILSPDGFVPSTDEEVMLNF